MGIFTLNTDIRQRASFYLIAVAIFSVVSAGVLIPFFILQANQTPSTTAGRYVWIRIIESVKTQPEVYFQTLDSAGNTVSWFVNKEEPTNSISYLRVAIINQQNSEEIKLSVDEASAELLDSNGKSYPLIDTRQVEAPLDTRYLVEGFQYIWGDISLQKGYLVEGYLLFETPPDVKITTLRWKTLDNISIYFE